MPVSKIVGGLRLLFLLRQAVGVLLLVNQSVSQLDFHSTVTAEKGERNNESRLMGRNVSEDAISSGCTLDIDRKRKKKTQL